ncbi:MAG: hypothetical protein Q9166_004332 [cf. Caloplaca sp. 2 TL-2023]
MDIVEPWLSATIEKDLNGVIEVTRGQPPGSPKYPHEDDGSNIRVQASKPGVVQIIKWEQYNETFTAWISDSRVYLKATFASKAARQHEKKTGKRITEETVGNIIQLEDAEIVATHIPGTPRTSRITLLIRRFKLIGSDTSAQIGNPRPFDATHEFDDLLRKLYVFRGLEDTVSRSQSINGTPEKSSPVGPRLGSFTPCDSGPYGSQQLFSQAPFRDPSNAAAKIKKRGLGGSRLSRDSSAGNEQNASEKPTKSTDKLIELLKGNKESRSRLKPATEDQARTTEPSSIQATTTERVSPPRAKSVALSQSPPERAKSPGPAQSPTPRNQEVAPTKVITKRIRFRKLRISKEQQGLLDSPGSWLPAKPGCRDPVANIPPAILEEITRSVEANAAKQEEVSEEHSEEAANSPIEEKPDQTAGTQREIPIPSQDWPASSPITSPRYKLPPDSPAVTDNMDLDMDDHVQQSRSGPSSSDPAEDSDVVSYHRRESAVLLPTFHVSHTKVLDAARAEKEPEPIKSNDNKSRGPSSSAGGVGTNANTIASVADSKEDPAAIADSDHSDSGSDLETQVPLRLDGETVSPTNLPFTQEVPATAVPRQESLLQVKRTPYGNWGEDNTIHHSIPPYSAPDDFSSPSKRRRMDEHGTAYSVEIDGSDSGHDPNRAVNTSTQMQSSGIEETVLAQIIQPEAIQKQESSINGLLAGDLTRASQPPALMSHEAFDTLEDWEGLERTAGDPVHFPYVSKRRKMQRYPINFGFSQDELPKEDPSITARRQREEYMAQRKLFHPESPVSSYDLKIEQPPTPEKNSSSRIITPKRPRTNSNNEYHLLGVYPNAGSFSPSSHRAGYIDSTLSSPRYLEHTASPKDVAPDQFIEPSMPFNADETAPGPGLTEASSPRPVHTIEPFDWLLQEDYLHSNLHAAATKLEAVPSTEVSQQTNRSGPAQSLPELMTPALSHSDLPQHTGSRQESISGPAIYLRFKSSYPAYHGSKDHFVGMCRKIDQLSQCDRMEHTSLWDDFIIRHKMDYSQYLQRCLENAEDPKSYEHFYRDEVDEPRFKQRIIQPGTLSEAFPPSYVPVVARDHGPTAAAVDILSPMARASTQRILSSSNISPSSPILVAANEAPNKGRSISSHPPVSPKRAAKRDKPGDQPRILEYSKETIDLTAVQSSSPTSAPPILPPSPSPARLIPKPACRLPCQEDKALASNDGSKLNSPVIQIFDREYEGRPSPAADLSKSKHTSIRKSIRASTSIVEAHRPELQAPPGSSQPPLSETFHRAKINNWRDPEILDENRAASRSSKLAQSRTNSGLVDERREVDSLSLRGYVKFYKAIKPGRGNSWAQVPGKKGEEGQKGKVKGVEPSKTRPIDVLSWHL